MESVRCWGVGSVSILIFILLLLITFQLSYNKYCGSSPAPSIYINRRKTKAPVYYCIFFINKGQINEFDSWESVDCRVYTFYLHIAVPVPVSRSNNFQSEKKEDEMIQFYKERGKLPGSRRETVPHELHHHLELGVDLGQELSQVTSTEIRDCYCKINVIDNYTCRLVYIAGVWSLPGSLFGSILK